MDILACAATILLSRVSIEICSDVAWYSGLGWGMGRIGRMQKQFRNYFQNSKNPFLLKILQWIQNFASARPRNVRFLLKWFKLHKLLSHLRGEPTGAGERLAGMVDTPSPLTKYMPKITAIILQKNRRIPGLQHGHLLLAKDHVWEIRTWLVWLVWLVWLDQVSQPSPSREGGHTAQHLPTQYTNLHWIWKIVSTFKTY